MTEESRYACLGIMGCDSKLKFLGTITIIILGIFISWTGNQIGIVESKVKFLGTIIILGIGGKLNFLEHYHFENSHFLDLEVSNQITDRSEDNF